MEEGSSPVGVASGVSCAWVTVRRNGRNATMATAPRPIPPDSKITRRESPDSAQRLVNASKCRDSKGPPPYWPAERDRPSSSRGGIRASPRFKSDKSARGLPALLAPLRRTAHVRCPTPKSVQRNSGNLLSDPTLPPPERTFGQTHGYGALIAIRAGPTAGIPNHLGPLGVLLGI